MEEEVRPAAGPSHTDPVSPPPTRFRELPAERPPSTGAAGTPGRKPHGRERLGNKDSLLCFQKKKTALHCQVLKAAHESPASWGSVNTNASSGTETEMRCVYPEQVPGREKKQSCRHLTASQGKAPAGLSLRIAYNTAFFLYLTINLEASCLLGKCTLALKALPNRRFRSRADSTPHTWLPMTCTALWEVLADRSVSHWPML